MAERGIGVLACQPNVDEGDLLRKDLSFQVAKFSGFGWVRFNPDVNYLGGEGPNVTVDEERWEFLDWHVDRCRRNAHRILLTLAVPPSGNGWDSVFEGDVFTWSSSDQAAVIFLYRQIISRILTQNKWPVDRLRVEIANEASRPRYGGEVGSPGQIQIDYVNSLGAILLALKDYFPQVRFLSHAMSYPVYFDDMVNPWKREVDWLFYAQTDVPDLLRYADIINVHIYYDRIKYRSILTWDEYRERIVQLFDDFLAEWESRGVYGTTVLQKPIWITEHGTCFNSAGMNQSLWPWANEDEVGLYRIAALDGLCQHPKADAVFLYNAMNELEEEDSRDGANFGLLRYDGTYTTSYLLAANANGITDPQIPAGSAPAADLAIAGY